MHDDGFFVASGILPLEFIEKLLDDCLIRNEHWIIRNAQQK